MNGYRPIVELMNTNFGIYGMAELSSAGNTYATTGGQFDMPMTIIGAGGTAPNQALGAEHSQVLLCSIFVVVWRFFCRLLRVRPEACLAFAVAWPLLAFCCLEAGQSFVVPRCCSVVDDISAAASPPPLKASCASIVSGFFKRVLFPRGLMLSLIHTAVLQYSPAVHQSLPAHQPLAAALQAPSPVGPFPTARASNASREQPFHAYVMGIPGLKICTAASPEAAYGITKSMIRDNGPGILFCPVKMMKGVKGELELGKCLPLNKAAVLHAASEESVASGKVGGRRENGRG